MNRCFFSALFLALALPLAAPAALAQIATADGIRSFPSDVARANFVVQQWPVVAVNGKTERAAPGARIVGLNNNLLMPASITGQKLVVNYRRNFQGQVSEVWVLTQKEAKAPIRKNQLLGKPQNSRKAKAVGTSYEAMPHYEAVSEDSGFWPQ